MVLTGGTNYYQIDEDVSRSGQPSGPYLERLITQNGVRSVLNMRGHNPNSTWYQIESDICEQYGVELIDFRSSSKRPLTPEQTSELIAILRNAPKPLHIHCQSGSDRTAFAAVLYEHEINGVSLDEAVENHASFWKFGNLKDVQRDFFEEYD